jgi:hypothetical protein
MSKNWLIPNAMSAITPELIVERLCEDVLVVNGRVLTRQQAEHLRRAIGTAETPVTAATTTTAQRGE